MTTLPIGVILRLVLTALESEVVIGNFDLSDSRTWTFKYTEDFKKSNFIPITAFPEVEFTYGHQICVKWLADRMNIDPSKDKGISFSEVIGRKSILTKTPLELHVVQ